MASQSESVPSHHITRLPPELNGIIASMLPQSDIKNLRQTCLLFSVQIQLRLSRVFLSANPLNVSVFRAIANHEKFRKSITEIIWDDARLDVTRHWAPPQDIDSEWDMEFIPSPAEESGSDDGESYDRLIFSKTAPKWFAQACRDNVDMVRKRKDLDVETTEHIERATQVAQRLPIWESWTIYQELLEQQQDVISTDADVEAFRYGLKRFPCLKRVTITPAAHGWLFQPLYETPMIRAFPYGFNYAIPRGWLTANRQTESKQAPSWDKQEHKKAWRGFCAAVRELSSNEEHQVGELLVDAHQLDTGLNCRVFEDPGCPEYEDLVNLLWRPGFIRLDLDLYAIGMAGPEWSSFRGGHICRVLGEAAGLRHVHMGTIADKWNNIRYSRMYEKKLDYHVPLGRIFPVEKWPHLQHFGLSRFVVAQANLLSFLATLPKTLKTVELSFLQFVGEGDSYHSLLDDMRDTLGWQDRPAEQQPRVSIGVPMPIGDKEGRGVWLDDEANDVIYRGAKSPFKLKLRPDDPFHGMGVAVDAFDPVFRRPWLSYSQYIERGIQREPRYIHFPLI